MRIFFDGCERPAVEEPLSDFFTITDCLDNDYPEFPDKNAIEII